MRAYKFSPNLASPEERRQTFVGREAILEDLLVRVRNSESGARHCILIGPRGIGKTHLLLLLADSIEADETLASRWVAIRFAEEEYSITSLAELLLKVVELLPNGGSEGVGRDVDLALGRIRDFSKTSGKRLLLLMDNIQLYFNRFPDTDVGRMRDILMSNSTFLVIGAAPSYFKQMTGYEEPFYNFFEPIHLDELRPEEVEDMLRRRAQFEGAKEFLERFDECHPKIRATAHLTGGNPRLILMLYQVMCESSVVEAAEAFKRLLDDLTPYLQGRMEGLPPQGGKVLDMLASMEGPSTPTELAEFAGMSPNTVTTQIKRLRDAGFIRQVKLKRSRSTRYEVTDRLFRMWREMRTETGRARLGLIIRFLELWYTSVELLGETGRLLTRLGEAQEDERPRFLLHLQYLKEATPELLRSEVERAYLYAESGRLELAAAEIAPLKDLASCDEDVRADPDDADAWVNRGAALGGLGRCQEALENFNKAIELQPDLAVAWSNRGMALDILGRHQEALENCRKAVQLQPDLGPAWHNCGLALGNLGRYEEALQSYDKAVQLQPDLAPAWYNRGVELFNLGRHDEAFGSFDKAVRLQPDDATAWNDRGAALNNLGRYEEALESFDKAVQLQPDDAKAWYNRGAALDNLGRYEEALETFDKAVRLRPDHADAWHNRGAALGNLGRYHEALEVFDKVIQLQPDDATAWSNRGVALFNLGRYDEALKSFDKAIQLQPDDALTWHERGMASSKLAKHEEAAESFEKVVQIQPDAARAWVNLGLALVRLEKHEQALESLRKAFELGNVQDMEYSLQLANVLTIETELLTSLRSLKEDNLGSARRALKNAIENGKQADEEDFQLLLFDYLRVALKSGKTGFVQEAIEIIVSELGEEYSRLLSPFEIALEYMQTEDVGILERLHQEVRELVLEIAEQAKDGK